MSEEKSLIITPGLDTHLVDAEAIGERVMTSMRKTAEAEILDQIREWLQRGGVIRATDVAKPILEELRNGRWESGMTVTFPRGKKPEPAID